MELATLATFFSGVSFLFFGISCLTAAYMREEFLRYGLDRQRPLVGILQLLGGLGLLLGYWFSPLLAAVAAGGLCLLMAGGVGVRVKIGDGPVATAPAFIYALLNGYLAYHYAAMAWAA